MQVSHCEEESIENASKVRGIQPKNQKAQEGPATPVLLSEHQIQRTKTSRTAYWRMMGGVGGAEQAMTSVCSLREGANGHSYLKGRWHLPGDLFADSYSNF